ncbi:unnamed protein product (macronuclear) [Paramecium tetraurelia]|uniref:Macro domain-containing protein n=1 Tax=Paramecium tetraurelia TaxID=5888 RepID=A0CX06_PARTE|nr:uncharacterized protein GSPATT00001526001 [Paramecium tetraurelia]CAK75323.1 unnamed protein product [Paramecium tetraurelia]|eukprot:XP_001442720.1 hypothetical protein (macronuclear) [Paramecium tetraurelia strain d4-2]
MLSLIQGDIIQQKADAIALPSDIALLKAPGLKQLHQNGQQQYNDSITNQKPFSQIQQTSVITLPLQNNQFKYIIYCIVPKSDLNNQELQLSLLLELLFENIFDEITFLKLQSILIPVLGCDNADFTIQEFLMAFQSIYAKQRDNLKDVNLIFVSQSQQEYEPVRRFLSIKTPNIANPNFDSIYKTVAQGCQTSLTETYNQFHQQNIKKNVENQKPEVQEGSEIAQYRRDYNSKKQNQQNQGNYQAENSHNQETLNQKIRQHNQNPNEFQQVGTFNQSNQSIILKSSPVIQSNKSFFSLIIYIDELILEQKDLIKFMLQVCCDLNQLHYKLLQDQEILEQSNQVFNYKLSYKYSMIPKELFPFCPPEMLENQQISETNDSYSLGIIFKRVLEIINYKSNQEDQQNMIQIQTLLDKLISQTTQRPLIDDIFSFLLSLQLNEQFIEKWTQDQKNINYFYRKRGIWQKIKDFKNQIMMKASFLNNQGSGNQQYSLIQIDNKPQDQIQLLNHQESTLFTKLQQNEFNLDCEYAQREQNYKFCQIDCVVISVDKYQFKQNLPSFIKFDSKLDYVLDKIITLAQNEKEHYLQSIRQYVPIFGCNLVLLVFCPNQDQTNGRQNQLVNCLRDILLYNLKYQKITTFCLCLDDICKQLSANQNDLSMDLLAKAFDEACAKIPDPVIWNEIQFNNQKWIVVKKTPMKIKILEQSIIIHNQDITQIKGVDAIVNVADPNLKNRGGICGAVFRAAGENLLEEEINMLFNKLGRKQPETSEVIVTKSYRLGQENGPKYIIHAVGPKYNPQDPQKSKEQLNTCIVNILQKCQEYKITSVAIPPISEKNFDFPKQICAQIFHAALLQFQFQNPMSIHIIDVRDKVVDIFKIIFKGEKLRETIHSKLDFAPPTDCLVCPINIQNYNSEALKRIIELAGPSFQNELEEQIKTKQNQSNLKNCQSFLIQGHKMKFNNIYQVLLISKPLNIIDKQTLLYQVYFSILVETFLKNNITSITILLYSILQQCLTSQEDFIKYCGKQAINILLKAIQDFEEKYQQECGKITILSNAAQFCSECELIFK